MFGGKPPCHLTVTVTGFLFQVTVQLLWHSAYMLLIGTCGIEASGHQSALEVTKGLKIFSHVIDFPLWDFLAKEYLLPKEQRWPVYKNNVLLHPYLEEAPFSAEELITLCNAQ